MVLVCGHCGNPRDNGAPAYRCTCIPSRVWKDPDLTQAARTMNLSAVIRCLRRHPATRRLTQTALANMCGLSQAMISRLENGLNVAGIDRAVTALVGLGVPGAAEGSRWRLPGDDAPLPADAHQVSPGVPCVVITSLVPIDVQVMDPPQISCPKALLHDGAAFIAHPDGPRLAVYPPGA